MVRQDSQMAFIYRDLPDAVLGIVVGSGAAVVVKEGHVADAAGLGAPAPAHQACEKGHEIRLANAHT